MKSNKRIMKEWNDWRIP